MLVYANHLTFEGADAERAMADEVAKSLGLSGSPAWKVFAEIRERKNRF